MRIADVKKLLLHLHMTIFAPLDHFVLFDPVIDLFHGVAGETVTAAVGHGIGIGTVTVDAVEHGFMPEIVLDVFFQCGVTGQAVSRAGKQRVGKDAKKKYCFHAAIILVKGE